MYRIKSAFAGNGRKALPTSSPAAPAREGSSEITPVVYESQIHHGYDQEEFAIFDRFRPVPTAVAQDFVADFLNVRTRVSFFPDELEHLDGEYLGRPIPGDFRGETIEWLGLLRSAADARGEYVAMELGAGYGPWLVSGAAAARHLDIEAVRLYAIEADADHFAFMRQHFLDNGLDPDEHTLLNAAVGAEAGTARWPRAKNTPFEWAARPAREHNVSDARYNGSRLERSVEVPVLAVSELIEREPRWDLVHIDVQGWEGEVCAAAAEAMDQRVHRIVVGLHSRKLEGEVLALFHSLGWVLENEKPTRFVYQAGAPTVENMAVLDGVQVWRNPRLTPSTR
ncbi:FkbM family methyltransferase [Inquilinus sp. NPDC058860]|uniref:FkbM family methyltransferase n=1 Tax=Inquilinus sp. NPDC058860 TaxID=3346652 RepID=UPI00368DB844